MSNIQNSQEVPLIDEILNLISHLDIEQREQLLLDELNQLPSEAKARIIGQQLGDVVMTVGRNSNRIVCTDEICAQIQNAPNLDMEAIIRSIIINKRQNGNF